MAGAAPAGTNASAGLSPRMCVAWRDYRLMFPDHRSRRLLISEAGAVATSEKPCAEALS